MLGETFTLKKRMDFSHGSVAASGVLSTGSLNYGERSLSSLTSEVGEARHRVPVHPLSSSGADSLLSPNNPLKQCRSAFEMDMDSREDPRCPLKLARTDYFISRNPDLKMQVTNSGTLGSLVRNNSIVSDGRLGCSPSNSSASDGTLLGSEASLMAEQRLIRADSLASCAPYPVGIPRGPLSYNHQAYPFRPSGLPFSVARESVSHLGIHDLDRVPEPAFTLNQMREFYHHALIYKYMSHGQSVPAELLISIRNNPGALAGLSTGQHLLSNMGWGNYHLGLANNNDPEPGRCRRTDGKKWRCSRDVVPDQKYCERHIHRGRHRSRKQAENQTTVSSQSMAVTPSSSGASSVSLAAALGPTSPSAGLRPSNTLNTQLNRSGSVFGTKSFSGTHSPNGSGAISVGSSNSGSHYQLPLQSAGGTPGLPTKDYRYLNGIMKTEIDLAPEQLFFSEASGSSRGLAPESQLTNGLSMLSSLNASWRSLPSKVPPAAQLKTNSGSLLQNNTPQMRILHGQDFELKQESNLVSMPMPQQQHSFLGSGFGTVEGANIGREPEGQTLRHFFDDWPRSRDPATLSWSDVDEEKSNRSSSTTQLSISIPMASSDFPEANASSPRDRGGAGRVPCSGMGALEVEASKAID